MLTESTHIELDALTPAAFVVKLTDTCNIACDYCYMFEFDTKVTGRKPKRMSAEIFDAFLERLKEHQDVPNAKAVTLLLHGGEPLLLGRDTFRDFMVAIKRALGGRPHTLQMQTNGLLLDERWLDLLDEYDIHFGISLDGPPEVNDKHRRTRAGAGTSESVLQTLGLVRTHPAARLFEGILTVIEPFADGGDVLRYLYEQLEVKSIQLLLPDGNYQNTPKGISGPQTLRGVGDYLISAFDAWLSIDDPSLRVPIFDQIILGLLGQPPTGDSFGGVKGDYLIVETDGSLLAHDLLRTCGDYRGRELNVHVDSLSAAKLPSNYPWSNRPRACSRCPVQEVCRGGHPLHRFDGQSFENQSIYCTEMYRVIRHIATKVRAATPDARTDSLLSTVALAPEEITNARMGYVSW
jgi:uncharacterized protein